MSDVKLATKEQRKQWNADATRDPSTWHLAALRCLLRFGRKSEGPWDDAYGEDVNATIPDENDAGFLAESREAILAYEALVVQIEQMLADERQARDEALTEQRRRLCTETDEAIREREQARAAGHAFAKERDAADAQLADARAELAPGALEHRTAMRVETEQLRHSKAALDCAVFPGVIAALNSLLAIAPRDVDCTSVQDVLAQLEAARKPDAGAQFAERLQRAETEIVETSQQAARIAHAEARKLKAAAAKTAALLELARRMHSSDCCCKQCLALNDFDDDAGHRLLAERDAAIARADKQDREKDSIRTLNATLMRERDEAILASAKAEGESSAAETVRDEALYVGHVLYRLAMKSSSARVRGQVIRRFGGWAKQTGNIADSWRLRRGRRAAEKKKQWDDVVGQRDAAREQLAAERQTRERAEADAAAIRAVMVKLVGQLADMKDTPDCWEWSFYHEGTAALTTGAGRTLLAEVAALRIAQTTLTAEVERLKADAAVLDHECARQLETERYKAALRFIAEDEDGRFSSSDARAALAYQPGCLGCEKTARHPKEGYECAMHRHEVKK